MKILVYILTLSLATALVLYNHKAFISISELIGHLDLISTQLEQRGRLRYQLQKQLTNLQTVDADLSELTQLIDSEMLKIDQQIGLKAKLYADLIDWKKWHAKEEYFRRLNEQYSKEQSESTSDGYQFQLEAWTNRMVDTLDEIQQQSIVLAKGLNQLMKKKLATVVSVNVSLVAAIFLIVIGFNYRENKRRIAVMNKLNESLMSREQSLISSKKVLVNLMEDLSQEKHSAIKLTSALESANEKLKSKHKDMQQFVYTVSHDLKAPLVTIGGFTKSLFNDLKANINEKQSHKFDRVLQNVKEMQTMLSDLLEISRVLTRDLDKSSINTEVLIVSQLAQLEKIIEDSEAVIELKEPLLPVFGNERLIGLCINNLVVNAINYSKPDSVTKISISTKPYEEGVKLEFQDNGVGIQEKDQQRIFNLFERASTREGSGLGLAIVKAVLDKHNGVIQLNSTPGEGSCFSLLFPNKQTN